MKNHNKRRIKKPSKKINIKKGGQGEFELSEGPIDVESHIGMNANKYQRHIEDMERKAEYFSNKLEPINQRITSQSEELAKLKEYDEAKLAADETRLQEWRINNANTNKEEHFKANDTFNQFIWSIVLIIKKFIEYFATFMAWLIANLSTFFAWLISMIFVIIYMIKDWLDSIFNGTFVNSLLYPLICYILGLLFFIAIIIIIIILIIYGVSLITRGNEPNAETQREKLLPTTININLQDLSNVFSTEKIGKTFDTVVNKINQYKPSFDYKMPFTLSAADFLYSPVKALSTLLSYAWNLTENTEMVASNKRSLEYTKNLVMTTLYGEEPNIYTDREVNFEGRSDNLLNINASLFSDPDILTKKNINNIDLTNTVINIARPNDLEWRLPTTSQIDVNKLSKSIINNKNNNNISLKDKTVIGLPWIEKDNYYVLSCEGAYFKSNDQKINTLLNNEKANILIDNYIDNTCTFNIDTESKTFTENKKRYINSKDLSNYI